jgi:acarbose 7IV-phosphotransferase
MKSVFIIGGTTFDHIVYLQKLPEAEPQTIHIAPFRENTGSTGAGKALNLTKLGVNNILYSVLGEDYYGKKIIKDLTQNKVKLFYDIDPAGTERHINIMDADGKRISMFITQSSEIVDFSFEKIENTIRMSDVIVLNIISYCRNLIPLIKKYNKPVWTDLHDYDGKNSYHDDFINASQYIHLSSDNLPDYLPLMQQLIKAGKELVVCTHGKKGATLLSKDGTYLEQAAFLSYPMVDANGAGDAFFSGFLYGWMSSKPYSECMKMGAICAGLCISSPYLASENLSASILENEPYKQSV